MFWPLLLSHLLADYPLQTDRMVQAKKTWPGLTVHVAVHFVTLLVILMGVIRMEWRTALPAALTVAGLHFAIDAWKNFLTRRWPQWVIGGYLQDQVLHILSLLLVSYAQARLTGAAPFALAAPWIIYGCGYVLVTHAWFVTERVFSYRDKAYQQWVARQLWPRMALRALLFSALLLGWNQLGILVIAGALAWCGWRLAWDYRWRALLIDSGVALGVLSLLHMATAQHELRLAAAWFLHALIYQFI